MIGVSETETRLEGRERVCIKLYSGQRNCLQQTVPGIHAEMEDCGYMNGLDKRYQYGRNLPWRDQPE